MELLLQSVDNTEEFHYNWDITVEDGIPELVPENSEQDQEASVITFLETNTIPLLEDKGNDWVGFLMKSKTLLEIDNQVRENLKKYLNSVSYTPVYTAKDGKLAVTIARTILNSGAVS